MSTLVPHYYLYIMSFGDHKTQSVAYVGQSHSIHGAFLRYT